MSILFYSLFLLAIVHLSTAAQSIIPNDPEVNNDPKYHCNTNIYEIGGLTNHQTVRVKGKCEEATCQDNKDITVYGCGAVQPPPGCKVLPGDLRKPYPDCCFIIECS